MMDDKTIYLDYAAATPLDESVLKKMLPFLTGSFYNPSAGYKAAKDVKKALEEARAKAAHWLGAKPSEIIFTAGATEANNLAIQGIMNLYPEGNVLVSAIEHESVLAPAKKYDYKEIKVGLDGTVDLNDLKKKIDDKTVLVSIMYANNEIGTVEPIREISKIVEEVRKKRGLEGLPIYLHTDAAQAANYLDLHANRLGVDLMSLNGGKIYGPKQSGCLYVKVSVILDPLILGGGQERNFRSGTENVAGAVGFAEALDMAQKLRHEELERLTTLQKHFIGLIEEKLPKVQINGSMKKRLPNNVHITIPGSDNERLLMELDEKGIQAAAGSACSSSDQEPSHVLKAIGKTEEETRSSLRLTMGRFTTEEQISTVVKTLAKNAKI
jgi:cysteine desulfurase